MKDINNKQIKLPADNVISPSLGKSIEQAIRDRSIPIPLEDEEKIQELQEQIQQVVDTETIIEKVVVTVDEGNPDEAASATVTFLKGVLTLAFVNVKGATGEALTFDDLTDEQKAELKGEKGDPLTFDDLTDEQKAELKGEPGAPGAPGAPGKDGAITNLAQSVSASDTTHATSGKAVADYVAAHGGGGSVSIDTTIPASPSDSKVPSTKMLIDNFARKGSGGGVVPSADEIPYEDTNVGAKLTELDNLFDDDSGAEFCIGDKDGNIIFEIKDGYPKTKNFDGRTSGGGSSEGSQWQGKTWYCYGTSLSDVDGGTGKYPKYVENFSGLVRVDKANGGQGITSASGGVNYNAIRNITDGKLNADLITIECGANDASAPLGTIYDRSNNNTFCGALNLCIQYLQENCPKAQIVVISSTNAAWNTGSNTEATPEKTYGSDNHTKYDQWEATRKVCMINSIPYIAMGEEGGLGWKRLITDYNLPSPQRKYLADAIHHTELGGKVLGLYVWSKLKMIPLWLNEL